MSEFFDAGRLLLLVSKQWYENRKVYLYAMLTMAGLMALWYVVFMMAGRDKLFGHEEQLITYCIGLLLASMVSASVVFSATGDKAKGISFLSVPASHFEKLLCGFIYTAVLMPLLYTGIFYLFTFGVVQYSNHYRSANSKRLEEQSGEPYRPATLVRLWDYDTETSYDEQGVFTTEPRFESKHSDAYEVLAVVFCVQAFYALGSIYFGRLSFVKTSVAAIVLLVAFLLYIEALEYGFDTAPAWGMRQINGLNYVYLLPDWVKKADRLFLYFVPVTFFWLVSYVRLKETQI